MEIWPSMDEREFERIAASTWPDGSCDDENGNCRRCGHPFDPHIVIAYDSNDYSKGGEMRCQVEAALVSVQQASTSTRSRIRESPDIDRDAGCHIHARISTHEWETTNSGWHLRLLVPVS
jgi:hypothetical protein